MNKKRFQQQYIMNYNQIFIKDLPLKLFYVDPSIFQYSFIIFYLQLLFLLMPTTCLICCQQASYFLLPPCNHKQMCWKCCMTLIEGSTFTCPYCNGTPQGTSALLYVSQEQMKKFTFKQIFKRNTYKSAQKSYQYYSNEDVAKFIEQQTSFYCRLCSQSFDNLNILKKHLNQYHHRQFCDVCLENRKCLLSQQYLFTEAELTAHLKKGQYSHQHELILYHPYCDFCRQRFYDVDAFRIHIKVSSHLKCHVCDQNFPKRKYTYYKDFNELDKHFHKSHYVCQQGQCIDNKLQNVFVSEQLLEEHKLYKHHREGKKKKQVLNILLFQKQEEQEWDKIGKDFSKEFNVIDKQFQIKNQTHTDKLIDIRDYYLETTKSNSKMSLENIKSRLDDYLFKTNYKSDQIHISTVPLFMPLIMASLSRLQLQKFIRTIFQPKYSESLIEIFFTKKFEYRSQFDYFGDIKRKIWNYCPIAYYYVFPQLIRYYKDSNPTKRNMDEFYSDSLRSLILSHQYVFHEKDRYSQVISLLQEGIEKEIYDKMIEQQIELSVYKAYLKELNPQFYQKNHLEIFYVQKEKIKNMYHMVEKTKTNELLKLNWLLKLGMSNQTYKNIYQNFFYKNIKDGHLWVKKVSLQELALLYAYLQICTQALFDKQSFQAHKLNPPTIFLSRILERIKICISNKDLTQIKQIEYKSIEKATKMNNILVLKKQKGVVNQQQHPSLLQMGMVKKTEDQQEQMLIFGKNVTMAKGKRGNKRKNEREEFSSKKVEEEDFPELLTAKNKKIEEKQQEEDFPTLQVKPVKEVKKKKGKQQDQSKQVDNFNIFDNKNVYIYRKNKQNLSQTPTPNIQEKEQWPSLVKQRVEKVEQEWPTLGNERPKVVQRQDKTEKKQEKGKKRDEKKEQLQREKQKQKQKLKEKEKQLKQRQGFLKVRLDNGLDFKKEEENQKLIEKQKEREQKFKKFEEEEKLKQAIRYADGFQSLIQKQKKEEGEKSKNKSIINTIIQEANKDEKESTIVIKKGKKGKAVLIEKVDFWSIK